MSKDRSEGPPIRPGRDTRLKPLEHRVGKRLVDVEGIGPAYSGLLEEAGVDSAVELAHRVAANLAARLAEINAQKKLVRRVPGEKTVAGWIAQAEKLPKLVEH